MIPLLRGLAALEPRLALQEARPLVQQLACWIELGDLQAIGSEPVWRTLAEIDGLTVQAFVWPVGARTPIHDHTSWGVYACVGGRLREERYVRLDDGQHAGRAHLRADWQRIWSPGEQSSLLPYNGGIHRVRNAGLVPAVSMHLYGPRLGALDGRDYDARRDRVCDRAPDDVLSRAA